MILSVKPASLFRLVQDDVARLIGDTSRLRLGESREPRVNWVSGVQAKLPSLETQASGLLTQASEFEYSGV